MLFQQVKLVPISERIISNRRSQVFSYINYRSVKDSFIIEYARHAFSPADPIICIMPARAPDSSFWYTSPCDKGKIVRGGPCVGHDVHG